MKEEAEKIIESYWRVTIRSTHGSNKKGGESLSGRLLAGIPSQMTTKKAIHRIEAIDIENDYGSVRIAAQSNRKNRFQCFK